MSSETEALLARIAELTQRMEQLEHREGQRVASQEQQTVSRRGMLRYAAVGASTAIAGTIAATAHPAAAATGGNALLGQANDADASTVLDGTHATDDTLHVTQTGGTGAAISAAATGVAIVGVSVDGRGAWGQSTTGPGLQGDSDSSSGVVATSISYVGLNASTDTGPTAVSASNISGDNTTVAISAVHNGAGAAIDATAGTGNALSASTSAGVAVQAVSSTGVGVAGTSGSAVGVTGTSGSASGMKGITTSGAAGVEGVSTTASSGVFGRSSGSGNGLYGRGDGTGRAIAGYISNTSSAASCLYGNTTGTGVGVEGKSSKGRGAQFAGKLAQLRMVPGSGTSHPSSGNAAGDFYVDKTARLWFYKGSRGWVQIV